MVAKIEDDVASESNPKAQSHHLLNFNAQVIAWTGIQVYRYTGIVVFIMFIFCISASDSMAERSKALC